LYSGYRGAGKTTDLSLLSLPLSWTILFSGHRISLTGVQDYFIFY
jgi:hypothetical protein